VVCIQMCIEDLLIAELACSLNCFRHRASGRLNIEDVAHERLGGGVHDEGTMFNVSADPQKGQVSNATLCDLMPTVHFVDCNC